MIKNKWLLGNADITEALALRREVFSEEQGFDAKLDHDEADDLAMHLIIYDGKTPVATGRVYHDGKTFRVGRCCVKKSARGQGVGDLLIKLLLLKVFEFGPSVVKISAQEHAVGFYEKYGFYVDGEGYLEEGEPHLPMSITKETLVFPTKCGKAKHFSDFFDEKPAVKPV